MRGIIGRAKLKLAAPKILLPGPGTVKLRCGGCGGTTFSATVRPTHQQARVAELWCGTCQRVYKLDDQGFLDGTGKVTHD